MTAKEIVARFLAEIEDLWEKYSKSEIPAKEYHDKSVSAEYLLEMDLQELAFNGEIPYEQYYKTLQRMVFSVPDKVERREGMYRQYENPEALESQLEDAKKRLAEAVLREADESELSDLWDTIEDLKERINFAWQDAYQE
jgi:inorganic pyrophosphatase/exopolyphosphatase